MAEGGKQGLAPPGISVFDRVKTKVIKKNDILDSLAPFLLPYKGAGSGILRTLRHYPHIYFINDLQAEQFTVIVHRPVHRP